MSRFTTFQLTAGAKVNASNNAGDTPWHWARNMGHQGMMELLEKVGGKHNISGLRSALNDQNPDLSDITAVLAWDKSLHLDPNHRQRGATKQKGKVLVQEHVPKVKASSVVYKL